MTAAKTSPDGLLSPGEAARRLGVTTVTLSRWVQLGVLTAAPSATSWAAYYEAEVSLLADNRRLRQENERLREAHDDLTASAARIAHELGLMHAALAVVP